MLTEILETLGRPGLLGIVGKTAEKRLQRALASYFRLLGQRAEALHLEKISQHDPELVKHGVEVALHHCLRTLTPLLKATLEAGIHHGMLAADKIHHFAEAAADDPLGDGTSMLSGEEAALYASIHAGEIVSGINSTTQQMIADIIQQGIDDSLGVDGTAQLLRQLFQDMTVSRSQMIASTEMNVAFSEAALRKLERLGIEYKQWITATQCCDICAENEDASPIPLDEEFPGGVMRPPQHPNCRCALTGARPPSVQ